MAKNHVIVIGVRDEKPQIFEDLTVDDCIRAATEVDERLAESLRDEEERLDAIREDISTNPSIAVEYFLLQRARSRTDELLSSDLDSLSPKEHRERVDQYHRYSSIGSALLYRDINFGGGSKFFSVTWPNFKWWPYKFNDAASSAKAWGGNILFEHSWYGGRRLYLIGIPYVAFPDLRRFGFDNIASSFASLP